MRICLTAVVVGFTSPSVLAVSINITQPIEGAIINGTVLITGTTADLPVGVVAVSIDGGTFEPAIGLNPWSFTWDTTTIANDSHTITALARECPTCTPVTDAISVTVANSPGGITDISAFYQSGQVFITWDETPGSGFRYRAYRSANVIDELGDLTAATYLGEVDDLTSENLRQTGLVGSPQFFRLTDLGTSLTAAQGLFVDTVDADGGFYYAVTSVANSVEDTTIILGNNALAAPIAATVATPRPVLQATTGAGGNTRHYAHWVSNRDAPSALAMWNQPSRAFNFRVIHSAGFPDPRPLMVKFHARGGNYQQPAESTHPESVIFAPDDWIGQAPDNTFWYGFSPNFPTSPDGSAPVNDYTVRRVIAEIDWVQANFPCDPERVYASGGSMGGIGSVFFAYRYPDRFAAVHTTIPKFDFGCQDNNCWIEPTTGDQLWGTAEQNFPCTDGIGVFDRLNIGFLAQSSPIVDYPLVTAWNGRNDTVVGWPEKPATYAAIAAARQPAVFLFDQRDHQGNGGSWATFNNTLRNEIWNYRIHQALPAFTNLSVNDDPGDGSPNSGDAVGTINGYVAWDVNSIEDTADQHSVTCLLRTSSGLENSPADTATVNWTPRRLQSLPSIPGATYRFLNLQQPIGTAIEDRLVTADANGIITVEGAVITRGGNVFRLEAQNQTVPAASTWGLVAMTLLVLAAGTLVLRRKGWTRCFPVTVVFLSTITAAIPASAQNGQPTGLYQLGAPNIRDFTFITGGTVSVRWDEAELATGQYDFSGVDQALDAVQAVGKKLVIHPFASRLPAHVLTDVPAAEQYFNSNFGITTAVPWSPTALSHWSVFINALADHQVLDSATAQMVRLADHPSLRSVDAPIVGLQGFRDIGGSLVNAPNYSRPDFIAGILASTHAGRNAFPNIAGHLALFSINDGQDAQFGGQSLSDAVLDQLEAEFNGLGQRRLKAFQENWSDDFPTASGSQGQNTLRIIADGGGHMLQATTSWTNPFGQDGQPPTEQRLLNVASGTPILGLINAFNVFGTRWFEIYVPDFDNAAAPTNQVYLGNGQYGDIVEPYVDELLVWNEFFSERFAIADAATITTSDPLLVDVLANELIPEGANVALLVIQVSQGQHGSVSIIDGGARVSYQPDVSLFSSDEFTYWVSDGRGGVSSSTVTIVSANAVPAASSGGLVAITLVVLAVGTGVLRNRGSHGAVHSDG